MNTTSWQRENAPTRHIGPHNKTSLPVTCKHVWSFTKSWLNINKRIKNWHRLLNFQFVFSIKQLICFFRGNETDQERQAEYSYLLVHS